VPEISPFDFRGRIDPPLGARDRAIVKAEVDKLANSVVDDRGKEFIEKRTEASAESRTDPKAIRCSW
jgi:hypothetical protein